VAFSIPGSVLKGILAIVLFGCCFRVVGAVGGHEDLLRHDRYARDGIGLFAPPFE
jgi:hypothetical protein